MDMAALNRLATTPSRDKERKRKKTGQRSDKGGGEGEGGEGGRSDEGGGRPAVEERREKRRARG